MKIRSKLAWTFIILLIGGVTAVSSYSILFIRNYLLQQGLIELRHDTRRMAVTVSHFRGDENFETNIQKVAQTVRYQVALYDSTGKLIRSYPTDYHADPYLTDQSIILLKARNGLAHIIDKESKEKLVSSIYLPKSLNAVSFIKLSQLKDQIYQPIKTIRWIIYYGMFISVGLIIIVSLWIARYLTKPITKIKDTAQAIAGGDVDRGINLSRKDEFGSMADSLNQMADKLRWDTEQMKSYAQKQQQFFADITHEIRNPLHTISASLEMVQIEELDQKKKTKYLKNAHSQVERLANLFKDLKTLQRYDADKKFVEPRMFNFAIIGMHMQEWYSDKATEKGLNLAIDQHDCNVFGDPEKIEQVIDNLVSNAIKYTSQGTVTLHYHQKGTSILIEVEDTGSGIAAEHMEHLFDRFYRTDKARSRDEGGTGLGLSVVKRILQAHHTDIQIESELGKGTRLWFELYANPTTNSDIT